MRTSLFAVATCLVLSSVTALGQPRIGSEVVSDPVPARDELAGVAAPAIAMARDRQGTVIAWTARNLSYINTIFAARLDETGQIVGNVHEVPKSSSTATVDAISPSISVSPRGDGFTLVWIEKTLSHPAYSLSFAVYCQLDSGLNASSPHFLTFNADAGGSSVLTRSGKSNWIAAAGQVWRFLPDGTVDTPIPAGITASDMAVGQEYPVLVSGQSDQSGTFTCSSEPGCLMAGGPFRGYCQPECRIYPFALRLVWLYAASAETILPFANLAQPSVQTDDRDIVVVWFDGDQNSGGVVRAVRLSLASVASLAAHVARDALSLGRFGPDVGPTRPDVATDGKRYVVVWRTKTASGDHDVAGASIDHDGTVRYFPIATSSADERDPSVLAVGNGRFLVAYEKIEGGERRLAGRFLDFEPRHRAVP